MKRKNLLFLGCLLLVSVFSFGLQLSKLGFYLDDWVILTAYNQDGVNGLINYSIGDSRPFVAWVWIVGSYLFGSQPLGWQIYSLAFRILTAFIGWLILNKFLTKHTLQAGIISLLFFIYPIFKQQSTSLAFSFHWVGYSLFLLSIYLQILGTEKKPNLNIWLILGTLFNGIQLFTQEYFIALELSRPFIIGLFLWKNSQAKKFSWNKWIFVNLPYLLLFFGYLGWRFIFVSLPVEDRNAPKLLEAFFSTPVYAIRRWVELFFQSMIEALLGSWYHALDPKSIVLKPVSAALSWGIVFICTTLSFLLLKMFAERSDKGIATNYQNWYKVAFPVGVILMVLGFIPGWGIGRTIADTSGLYNDRFGLPAMFGSSIVVVSGIEWFIENRKAKAFLFSILISIAIGYQYRIQTEYVNSWLQQKNFHDQLLTRAPEIQPNTAIISNQVIAKFVGSWADTSAINQMYDPTKKYDTNILWYYTIGDINLDFLQKNYYSLTERNKFLIFNGNLNDSIVITNPSSTQCLWVLDESDRNNRYIDS